MAEEQASKDPVEIDPVLLDIASQLVSGEMLKDEASIENWNHLSPEGKAVLIKSVAVQIPDFVTEALKTTYHALKDDLVKTA